MAHIENAGKSPIILVGDVIFELQRLSSTLYVMSHLAGCSDGVDEEAIGDTMGFLQDCLDRQIEVLNSIEWSTLGQAKGGQCA